LDVELPVIREETPAEREGESKNMDGRCYYTHPSLWGRPKKRHALLGGWREGLAAVLNVEKCRLGEARTKRIGYVLGVVERRGQRGRG